MARAGWSTSNYLRNTASAPITAAPFTVTLWGWRTANWFSTEGLVSVSNTGATTQNAFFVGDYEIGIIYNGSSTFISGSANPLVGMTDRWVFFAWVERASNDRSGWVNTTEYTSTANLSLSAGVNSVTIGVYGDSTPSNAFGGRLGEIGIWDRALGNAEILQLAAAYTPDHLPDGLVGYWPLNDGTGDERDFGSGGLTLTETGTVTKVDHPKMIQVDDDQLIITASAAPPATIIGRNLIYGEKLNRLSLVG